MSTLSRRLPSLDGWRALSIVLVLGEHTRSITGFPAALDPVFLWAMDGIFGVTIFFIISGFLITWLMLGEVAATGAINLRNFYLRRTLRIFPIYFGFLAVLGLLQHFTPFEQGAVGWWSNLTFTTNFGATVSWSSAHLWSLAVEEQFYLIWPCAFVILGCASHPRRAITVLAVPILGAPIARVFSYLAINAGDASWGLGSFSFFNFCDALAIGCLAAYLLRFQETRLRRWVERAGWRLWIGAALLIAFPYTLKHALVFGVFTIPFGTTAEAVGIVILILRTVLVERGTVFRCLNLKAVQFCGVMSFSIYIWQQLFCTNPAVFGLDFTWGRWFFLWPLPALAVALLSFYALERPLFRLRARLR